MTSPLINGPRTAEDIVREHLEAQSRKPTGNNPPPPPNPGTPAVTSADDYIKLENIACVDADGNVFERYDVLYVRKNVEKDAAGTIQKFTLYNAIHHCESAGFLPSAALMANIHVAVYRAGVERQPDGSYRTKNAELEEMLEKLQNRGDGVGGHLVNTVVDLGTQQLIHYPTDSDFPKNGGTARINTSRTRTMLGFTRENFAKMELEDALQIVNYKRFIQNYSGLHDPAVLLEVAAYHQKTARVWVSSSPDTRVAWFGCNQDNFNLSSGSNLGGTGAARGVCLDQPRSGAP